MKAVCTLCPGSCEPEERQTGFGGARKNRDGALIAREYLQYVYEGNC